MLGWKERRRRRVREQPFPPDWRSVLEDSVPLYRRLPSDDREELHGHVQVLLAEKHFEGAAGLEATDRMRLVVAAQAGILLLHRPTNYFPKLVSILLYPSEYSVQEAIEDDDGLVDEIDEARVGESWQTGTLILSWEEVGRDLESDVQNVVLHEFAHQLDAESGETNGAPILPDRELRQRWADAMSDAFERLTGAVERDEETLLDPYGAEDPAEFFAVATEAFFLTPSELAKEEPDIYAVLSEFFQQNPTRW
jgi:Mlc titration factor MtfA (ptsG expression regulator)